MTIHRTILLSTLAVALQASTPPPSPCPRIFDGTGFTTQRIFDLNRLKGTFEAELPVEPESMAEQFPKATAAIRRLFRDRPSFWAGLNNYNPPLAGETLGTIIGRLNEFAFYIGEDLDVLIDHMRGDRQSTELLRDYAQRFRAGMHFKFPSAAAVYDPASREQLDLLSRYGKFLIDANWSELRVSLLLPNIIGINATVKNLVFLKKLSNKKGDLTPYLFQEIDHIWYPEAGTIAFGDTKVYDSTLRGGEKKRNVLKQLERYLEIASVAGEQQQKKARVYYFFVAGVTPEVVEQMQTTVDKFNRRLLERGLRSRPPVDLVVYGKKPA